MRKSLIVMSFFGKWIADNAIEISIIDVIQEED